MNSFTLLAEDFTFNFIIVCGDSSITINDPMLEADKD